MSDSPSLNDRLNEFARLFSKHDRNIFLFVLSLVPNWADAEEIQQETNVKLWQEFDKFELGTDFGAWARTIAWYEVMRFREREQRTRQNVSRAFLDLVAARVSSIADDSEDRSVVLAECVDDLSVFSRELVRLYYTVGRTAKDIASELQSTPDAIYKALQRARFQLRACVTQKLSGRKRA
jgi:RNA polymerase sigma-70 factor (ECF subfamily)